MVASLCCLSGASETLALWSLHTYVLEAFDVTPYISVCSPVMGCGKTRVVEIAGEVVYRPVQTANATTAATFRLIDQYEPTLLIDEQDTFLGENMELKGVLNTGYKRGATIPRVVGDNQEVRQFKTFSPKMIAGIGALPQTLRDRSIKILMEKKGTQRVAKWTRKRRAEFTDLRRRCVRWAHDHINRIPDIEPTMPESLTDRAEEIWEPLFQIAAAAGGNWPQRVNEAVTMLQGKDVAEDDVRIQLLSDIRDLFTKRVKIASDELPALLHPLEDRPWAEYGRRNPKPITKGQIQSILRSFGIKAKQFRDGEDRRSGYEKDHLLSVFDRYLSMQNVTTRHTSNDADSRRFSARDTLPAVTCEKTAENSADTGLSRCHVSERTDRAP